MAAPDVQTVLDLRPAIEENTRRSLLDSFDKVFTRMNAVADLQKDRPRIELKARVGGALLHRALCPDGNERPDQWHFDLAVQAVTEPVNVAADNTLHSAYVAKVRDFMATLAQLTWEDTTNWPYHLIAETLVETGDEDNLKTNEGLEYTLMNFAGVIGVRSDAWPN